MTDQNKKYLHDILSVIGLIEDFLQDIDDFEDYAADEKTRSAVERQLGIIGEAANKLKNTSNLEIANVHQVVGLRNRIIHAYDHIDDTII